MVAVCHVSCSANTAGGPTIASLCVALVTSKEHLIDIIKCYQVIS